MALYKLAQNLCLLSVRFAHEGGRACLKRLLKGTCDFQELLNLTPMLIEKIARIQYRRKYALIPLLLALTAFTTSKNSRAFFALLCARIVANICGKTNYTVQAPQTLQLAQRAIIIAHRARRGRPEAHVEYICRHGKALGWTVILVVSGVENTAVDSKADAVMTLKKPVGKFSAWKTALHAFPQVWQYEEVILCSDDMFAPIGSFAVMHDAMQPIACDYWGISGSENPVLHPTGPYIVLRKRALTHPACAAFFAAVPITANGQEFDFPAALGCWLHLHHLKPAIYMSAVLSKSMTTATNPWREHWRTLLDVGIPLLRPAVFHLGDTPIDLHGWLPLLRGHGYPVEFIFSHCWERGIDITPTLPTGKRSGIWPPDVLALQECFQCIPTRSFQRTQIGIFIHCYYPELLDELQQCLQQVPHAHWHISTDTPEKAALIARSLEPLHPLSLDIQVFPNYGWDIAPLLVGFREELQRYPLALKLHTKRSTQMPVAQSDAWRKLLFSSLAGDVARVRGILHFFRIHPQLGILCPPPALCYVDSIHYGANFPTVKKLASSLGIELDADTMIDFPMGSMFWFRPEALRPWLDQKWTFADFGATDAQHRDGSLAHALERLFFFGCGCAGYTWGRLPPLGYSTSTPVPFSPPDVPLTREITTSSRKPQH